MQNTENVVDRFRKAITLNRFTMQEELEMINILVKKYNFKSVSEYAKSQGISQPAALKRVNKGSVMFIEMIGKKFVID